MEQMFVVTLREGIEAFLIVAITIAYLRKTGRDALLPSVWWGAGAAVLLSVILGVFLAEYAVDRKSTRLNSSHIQKSRMPSSA